MPFVPYPMFSDGNLHQQDTISVHEPPAVTWEEVSTVTGFVFFVFREQVRVSCAHLDVSC